VDRQRARGRSIEEQRAGVDERGLRAARVDTFTGMFFSQLVAYCVILTGVAVLHARGRTAIQSAADAAQAPTPLAGVAASTLFSVGLVATGAIASPVLSASSAYAVGEVASLPASLTARPRQQPVFTVFVVLATAIGVAMNLLSIDVIQALVIASASSGIAAVPLLVLLTLFGSDPARMVWTRERLAQPVADLDRRRRDDRGRPRPPPSCRRGDRERQRAGGRPPGGPPVGR
jgi:Mn2+/Fe2+ NRAMP family transporter